MESTGQAGRIQISEATAVILRKKGKEQWLKPREEGIDAKGKVGLSRMIVLNVRRGKEISPPSALAQQLNPSFALHPRVD